MVETCDTQILDHSFDADDEDENRAMTSRFLNSTVYSVQCIEHVQDVLREPGTGTLVVL